MGRIAFVFSGQGDQYPGMGRTLYEQYPAAARVFQMCEEIRPGTIRQCFDGTDEELKETSNTQPCLFAMELAAAEVLREKGILPDAAAGFSLGEMAAAVFAGVFDKETGFRLVCKRGELMHRESRKVEAAMAAVVKLDETTVTELCGKFTGIYAVNFNCPGQITVSGLACQMPAFAAAVKAVGGRALPLKVKGAFHSPFMQEAADAFGSALKNAEMKERTIPVYSNVTGQVYDGDVAELLAKQIASPVQWERIVRNMIADGIDTFIEIGPGKTLTNMIRKTDSRVTAFAVSEYLAEETPC